MTDEDQIQVLATATSIVCARLTGSRLAVLQASLDQACAIPAGFGWERKAAAHAEFFNAIADAGTNAGVHPRLARVVSSGVGMACHLMITAGCTADGVVISSRKWMLAHLHAGDAQAAAREMERHLKVLHFMSSLAAPPAQRASA